MIINTSMSGVIFTKDIENGNNYYVINYDDITGKTNTVTSGKGSYSNKILYIFKDNQNEIRSPRFKKLIGCIKQLEKITNNDNLDIEFAITKKLKLYVFQVRAITTFKKWKGLNFKKHKKILSQQSSILKKILKRKNGVVGKSTILGQMPDWNPVEIIGKNPTELSSSLYKKVITDEIWSKARVLMGYKDMTRNKLMFNIFGQPYIDTRLSLNSFLPNKTPNKISKIIVEDGIERLKDNPFLHDKIEFEISTPSYSFDLIEKLQRRFKKKLSQKEIKIFSNLIKQQTLSFMDKNKNFSIEKTSIKIEQINKKFETFNNHDFNQLPNLLAICKNIGTLNFSILARHGFVAKSFLNSLVIKKIISSNEVSEFEQNLNTITKIMMNDLYDFKKNKTSQKNFNKKYGHLRPGTYDITSKRYDQIKDLNFKTKKIKKNRSIYKIFEKRKNKIEKILKKHKFFNINYVIFINYLSSAICQREYSKFIFTKYLSLILEIIAKHGSKLGLSRVNLSHLPIKYFLNKKYFNNKKFLLNKSLTNLKTYNINKNIKLPMLIQDRSYLTVIPYQVNLPNYITKKKINGEFVINPDIKNFKNIRNKLVLIENADPGYDWIFGNNIKGLITKYGGINSHMAIRCAELSIPAVIGCGEQIFNQIKEGKEIFIDCSSSLIFQDKIYEKNCDITKTRIIKI